MTARWARRVRIGGAATHAHRPELRRLPGLAIGLHNQSLSGFAHRTKGDNRAMLCVGLSEALQAKTSRERLAKGAHVRTFGVLAADVGLKSVATSNPSSKPSLSVSLMFGLAW